MADPEHVLINRDHWNRQAAEWVAAGERNWEAAEPCWGMWGIPEEELVPRPATFAAFTPAIDAPGCVLVLDARAKCAFVLRPCQMTPLARPDHRQRYGPEH